MPKDQQNTKEHSEKGKEGQKSYKTHRKQNDKTKALPTNI